MSYQAATWSHVASGSQGKMGGETQFSPQAVRQFGGKTQSGKAGGQTGCSPQAVRQFGGKTQSGKLVVRHGAHPRQSGSLLVRHSQARLVVRQGAHPRQSGSLLVRHSQARLVVRQGAHPRQSGDSSSAELIAKPPQARLKRSMFRFLARRSPRMPSFASRSRLRGSMPFWLITTKVSPSWQTWSCTREDCWVTV